MIQVTPHMRILVCHQSVDFRKGMDRLAQMCRAELQSNPFSGALFLFRNRIQTGIKILVYDGQGFWLCHKRLSTGRFQWWPTDESGKTAELLAHQLQVLLAGGNPSVVKVSEIWRQITPEYLGGARPCVLDDPDMLGSHERDLGIPGQRSSRGGPSPHQ